MRNVNQALTEGKDPSSQAQGQQFGMHLPSNSPQNFSKGKSFGKISKHKNPQRKKKGRNSFPLQLGAGTGPALAQKRFKGERKQHQILTQGKGNIPGGGRVRDARSSSAPSSKAGKEQLSGRKGRKTRDERHPWSQQSLPRAPGMSGSSSAPRGIHVLEELQNPCGSCISGKGLEVFLQPCSASWNTWKGRERFGF